jgi:hypothetical protein
VSDRKVGPMGHDRECGAVRLVPSILRAYDVAVLKGSEKGWNRRVESDQNLVPQNACAGDGVQPERLRRESPQKDHV